MLILKRLFVVPLKFTLNWVSYFCLFNLFNPVPYLGAPGSTLGLMCGQLRMTEGDTSHPRKSVSSPLQGVFRCRLGNPLLEGVWVSVPGHSENLGSKHF